MGLCDRVQQWPVAHNVDISNLMLIRLQDLKREAVDQSGELHSTAGKVTAVQAELRDLQLKVVEAAEELTAVQGRLASVQLTPLPPVPLWSRLGGNGMSESSGRFEFLQACEIPFPTLSSQCLPRMH